MWLPRMAVRRPVTTVMALGIVLLVGFVALAGIPVDLLPDLTFPVIAVMTRYPGAGPREVENLVTRVLEEAIGAVGSLRTISSESMEGLSVVVAEFDWGTDMDVASIDVREKIELGRRFLPSEVSTPTVIKADPSLIPMMQVSLSGSSDLIELTRLAEQVIKERLERIDGVAAVTVQGGVRREIVVSADPGRLEAQGLTLPQLVQALRLENLSLPGGEVAEAGRRLSIRTFGEFGTAREVAEVPLTTPLGAVVRLGDVAVVEETASPSHQLTRLNGRPSVTLAVQKQTGGNTVQVARRAHAVLRELAAELPPEVELAVAMDQSRFILSSVRSVAQNAATGAALAVLVLWAFLRDLGSTLVVGVAIPVSIVATFALMHFAGLTLNLMSLGGLALGVGMLVDNAIVVLESIHRHQARGGDVAEGAVAGAGEVGMAVTASTLTTVAVFLPILFIQGLASILFRQIAITVSFSLLASLAVALSFIPMATARLGSRPRRQAEPAWLNALERRYEHLIRWALDHRGHVIALALAALLLGLACMRLLGSEFLPTIDRREIGVDVTMPRGSTLTETDRVVRQVEQMVNAIPGVEVVFAAAGSGGTLAGLGGGGGRDVGTVQFRLRSGAEPTVRVVEQLRGRVATIPGARVRVKLLSSIAGEQYLFGAPISVKVRGSDLDTLASLASEVARRVGTVSGTRDVSTSVGEGLPELRVVVDRTRASFYGLSTAAIAGTLRVAVEGEVATRFREGDEEVEVRVALSEAGRRSPADLGRLTLLGPTGVAVRLEDVARIEPGTGPATIQREGQSRMASVTADVAGRDVGRVADDVRRALADLRLPPGYTIEFGGETREMAEAFGTLRYALALAVVLVYMVLASQFESMLHPLTIMVSVPLAFVGAVVALAATGQRINVASLIGIIALAGIVVNNAIVLVDYLNQLRAAGLPRADAIVQAGRTRLRPILMTTTTTLLGLLPLAMGWGAGAELQAPLATAMMGGLAFSTLLTLVLVPVLYTAVEDLVARQRIGRRS